MNTRRWAWFWFWAFWLLFSFSHVGYCADYKAGSGYTIFNGDPVVVRDFEIENHPFRFVDFSWGASFISASTFQGKAAPANVVARALISYRYKSARCGAGGAWLQNYLPYNGQHVNFSLECAYQLPSLPIVITYTHVSDADIRFPNYGRDFITLGYRFTL